MGTTLGCSPAADEVPPGGNGGSSGSGASGGVGNMPGVIVPPEVLLGTCGNGALDAGEICDDGNIDNADGCNRVCQVEADYSCPTPGQACVYSAVCGDGMLSSAEACDDGNALPGDGCAADCSAVDSGWQCRVPGRHCVPLCGDGVLTGGENCDVGAPESGDGCSSTCLIEPGWSCDATGCVQAVCGNGMQEVGESCDAGELNGLFHGDATGCSKTCTEEPNCRVGGSTTACTTACGDGNIDAGEGCDDANAIDGDGCSSACVAETGFTCTEEARKDTEPCTTGGGECLKLPVTYRDFDGQNVTGGHPDFFFMGATPTGGTKTVCVPNASGLTVAQTSLCGSDATDLCTGLVTGTLGADGKPVLAAGGSTCACRFTDWDQTGVLTGVAGVQTCTVEGTGQPRQRIAATVKVIQSAASFQQWYADSAQSTSGFGTLELAQIGASNQYQFSSSGGRTVYDDIHDLFLAERGGVVGITSLSSGFFPLETQPRSKVCNIWPYWRFAATGACQAGASLTVPEQWDPRGWYGSNLTPPAMITGGPAGTLAPIMGERRNFYFTSEARYLFRYAGGETLAFFGDDDVWVYINGRLVLDLGAPHERLQGQITLTATGASYTISAQNVVTGAAIPVDTGTVPNLGLVAGNTYEIAVFHADRHPRESNYQLTLSGFSTTRSICQPQCGDGATTAGEECDDGATNQDDVYGGCTTQCKFGPFCGDGVMNGPEECDAGRENTALYGTPGGCTSACTRSHFCGDGHVDTAFMEQCDSGTPEGNGVCTAECRLGVQ